MHGITIPTAETSDFLYPASDVHIKEYVFENWPLPPGRELFVTKFDNLTALKEIAQDLAHNRSHAGAGTIVKILWPAERFSHSLLICSCLSL